MFTLELVKAFRLEFDRPLDELPFGVADAGMAIAANHMPVVTVPSLNQTTALRLANGSAELQQTVALTFELSGRDGGVAEIGTSGGPVDVGLGPRPAESVGVVGTAAPTGPDNGDPDPQ